MTDPLSAVASWYSSWSSSATLGRSGMAGAETQLIDAVRTHVRGRPGSASPVRGPDVVVDRGPDALPLAIELKIWSYTSQGKNISNRLVELLGLSVRFRREFVGGVQLSLLVVIVAEATVDWQDELADGRRGIALTLHRLAEVLDASGAEAGFNRVVVGLAGGQNSQWLSLGPNGDSTPTPDFAAAVAHLEQIDPGDVPDPGNQGAPVHGATGSLPRILLVADEWKSRMGGISTFNRELAAAFAEFGCEVHVAVPEASSEERDAASARGATLVTPDPVPGVMGKELLLTRPRFEQASYRPDVIIGHGRILGPYAYALQNLFFSNAQRVHIVHTDAERLESAKEQPGGPSRMMTAEERHQLEVELAISANVVAGVGTLLAESIDDAMRGLPQKRPTVLTLLPGLRDWNGVVDPDDIPARRNVLLIARAEDIQSKGIDIAVNAMVNAVGRFGPNAVEPPTLIVRGVPTQDRDEVKERLETIASPHVRILLRSYSAEEATLRADLWQSRVVILPSRHEGFGLAAYEAIAAGVPVLISDDSGLARLLKETVSDADRPAPREILPVRGDEAEVADLWGATLYEILIDSRAAFLRAADVRRQIADRVDWGAAVRNLLEALGYPALDSRDTRTYSS